MKKIIKKQIEYLIYFYLLYIHIERCYQANLSFHAPLFSYAKDLAKKLLFHVNFYLYYFIHPII